MRLPFLIITILITLGAIVDLYIWRALKKRFLSRIPARVQLVTALLFGVMLIVTVCLPRRSGSDSTLLVIMWLLYGYLTVYLPKCIFVVIDLIAYLPRLWGGRRAGWLSVAGAAIGGVVFIVMWWGALFNRYNIQERGIDVYIDELPASFDGYRIVQLSDLHVGTFGTDTTFVSRLVNRVNGLCPDVIVFTGDIVNRRSGELPPFVGTLGCLAAADGVYSILGNHDYGDYSTWESLQAKNTDCESLHEMERSMGWNLMLNSHDYLRRGNDSIALVGVENVGDPPFHTYGSLKKAYPDVSDNICKILLSHNPAHWVNDIRDNDSCNIALTLSGHTHAMQIEVAGLSPAAWRYPTWGGLYSDDSGKRSLYVNIGAGTVGLPMRIGATPEITVITLHKTKDGK